MERTNCMANKSWGWRALCMMAIFIYSANIVKELENLSDDFFLINDFTCSFAPQIYKDWSEQSLNNLSLRFPVQQILRTSFALYKLLNWEISKSNFPLKKHHWGHRQVTIKSLIVFINQKPKEEFQYVKILTLKELVGFV